MGRHPKSTSLADVNAAMMEDNQSDFDQRSYENSELARQSAPPIQAQTFKIYKLVDTKRKGRIHIGGIDEAVNPKTNRPERIWLISGAQSIWTSELKDLLSDKDYVNSNRRSLTFESGILRIPMYDQIAIEWINNCSHLIDNPSRRTGSKYEFFEYNPEKQAKESLAKEMLELEMAFAVKDMPIDKVKKLAGFLGISFYADYGLPKTDDGIRSELILLAKRKPDLIKKNLDNKEVDIAYAISKCIIETKIDISLGDGNVGWGNGRIICKIPMSRQAPEYLLELALTNSREGKEFLNELEKQMFI